MILGENRTANCCPTWVRLQLQVTVHPGANHISSYCPSWGKSHCQVLSRGELHSWLLSNPGANRTADYCTTQAWIWQPVTVHPGGESHCQLLSIAQMMIALPITAGRITSVRPIVFYFVSANTVLYAFWCTWENVGRMLIFLNILPIFSQYYLKLLSISIFSQCPANDWLQSNHCYLL